MKKKQTHTKPCKDGINNTLYKHHCQCIAVTLSTWSIPTLSAKNTMRTNKNMLTIINNSKIHQPELQQNGVHQPTRTAQNQHEKTDLHTVDYWRTSTRRGISTLQLLYNLSCIVLLIAVYQKHHISTDPPISWSVCVKMLVLLTRRR